MGVQLGVQVCVQRSGQVGWTLALAVALGVTVLGKKFGVLTPKLSPQKQLGVVMRT